MSLRVRQIDRREWLLAQTATECQRHGQKLRWNIRRDRECGFG